MGDFKFRNGYPTAEASAALLAHLMFNRAVEVFLSQIPAVSVFAEHRGLGGLEQSVPIRSSSGKR